jgi:hypothetical protein
LDDIDHQALYWQQQAFLFLIKRHACMQEKEACMGWKRKKGPRE